MLRLAHKITGVCVQRTDCCRVPLHGDGREVSLRRMSRSPLRRRHGGQFSNDIVYPFTATTWRSVFEGYRVPFTAAPGHLSTKILYMPLQRLRPVAAVSPRTLVLQSSINMSVLVHTEEWLSAREDDLRAQQIFKLNIFVLARLFSESIIYKGIHWKH